MSNLLYDSLFGCHAGDNKPFLTFADGGQISYDAFFKQSTCNVIQAACKALVRGESEPV